MRIAVYCSAKAGLPQNLIDDARTLGNWIGRNGHQLVYGGLQLGLMNEVASAAKKAGALVMGVVPQNRMANIHPDNTVNLFCADLHERKQMMEENADVFVALDGGIGTLDEIFAALASMTFFCEPKPIFMLNRDGIFNPITHLMANLVRNNLATPPASRQIQLIPDIQSLLEALQQAATHISENEQ